MNTTKENNISTLDELFNFVSKYSDKKLYFRGEHEDYGESSCLPPILRCNNCDFSEYEDNSWQMFTEKLESLGVGTPYIPYEEKSDDELIIINNTLLNNSPICWKVWCVDKLRAIMKHYAPDLKAIEDALIRKTDQNISCTSPASSYLDITSDIMVALHFACSKFCFRQNDEDISQEINRDGYIFVFDLNNIENKKYLSLVHYPSYAYFYRKGDKYIYQPFDRITHQRGAFLAPKIEENREIYFETLKEEIKELYVKYTLKSNVKQELFQIFGGKDGWDYFFPKIPLLSPKNSIIPKLYCPKLYEDLKGVTILK